MLQVPKKELFEITHEVQVEGRHHRQRSGAGASIIPHWLPGQSQHGRCDIRPTTERVAKLWGALALRGPELQKECGEGIRRAINSLSFRLQSALLFPTNKTSITDLSM